MSKPKRYENMGYNVREYPQPCTQPGFEHRQICQGCIDEGHVQLDSSDAFDCKIVFYPDGECKGQCCCYSKEHSYRRCQKCHNELKFEDGWDSEKKRYRDEDGFCLVCRMTAKGGTYRIRAADCTGASGIWKDEGEGPFDKMYARAKEIAKTWTGNFSGSVMEVLDENGRVVAKVPRKMATKEE